MHLEASSPGSFCTVCQLVWEQIPPVGESQKGQKKMPEFLFAEGGEPPVERDQQSVNFFQFDKINDG